MIEQNRFGITFFLLLSAVILSPINYNIFSIRPLDIVLILFIIVGFPYLMNSNRDNKKLFYYFLTVFFTSIFLGFLFSENRFNILKGIFLYKYLLPFLFIGVFYNLKLSKEDINKIFKFSFYTFLFLVFWVYYDVISYSFNDNGYSAYRPAFPFRENIYHSDAHLYSVFISIGLLFYTLLFQKLGLNNTLKVAFILVSVIALLITGSKSGILILVLGTVFYFFTISFKKTILFILSICLLIFVLNYSKNFIYIENDFYKSFIYLSNRVFNYDFLVNLSENARIIKMNIGIEDSSIFYYLIGVGVFSSKLTWHDSLVGTLFSHVGLIGFILFMYILYKFFRNNDKFINKETKKYNKIFFLILFCYFIANIITEFFLVSRSLFPILLYLGSLYHYMKIEYETKN